MKQTTTPSKAKMVKAAIACKVIEATCGGDGHTLFDAELVGKVFDEHKVPRGKDFGWTLTKRTVKALEAGGGWGREGARVIDGDSIVRHLASWSQVDTSIGLTYGGRGSGHRAAVSCFYAVAKGEPEPTRR